MHPVVFISLNSTFFLSNVCIYVCVSLLEEKVQYVLVEAKSVFRTCHLIETKKIEITGCVKKELLAIHF